MSELRPILHDDPSEQEKLLLGSARLDAPSPHAKGRVLAVLGVTTVTTATGAGAAATTAGVAAKWIAIGVLGGAATFGAARELRPTAMNKPAVQAPEAVLSVGPIEAPPRTSAAPIETSVAASRLDETPHVAHTAASWRARVEPLASAPQPTPMPSSEAMIDAVSAPSNTAPSNAGNALPGDTGGAAPPAGAALGPPPIDPATAPGAQQETQLADEVAKLDEARRALVSRDPALALRLLGDFDRRFVRPVLAEEATVLRIEALAASNRKSEARRLADEMLTLHPDSPYARRVQTAIGKASGTP